jgi:hypothetical protein
MLITVRPKLVEGLNQRFLNGLRVILGAKARRHTKPY